MSWLLERMARAVARTPTLVLLALLAVTVVLGGFATQQTTDTDLTSFAPDSDLARAFERVEDEFSGGGARVQVIIDAGEGEQVLSPAGLAAADAIAGAVRAEESIDLAAGGRGVASFGSPVFGALEAQGLDPADASPDEIAAAAELAYEDPRAAQALDLLSGEPGGARAGLVVIELDPSLDDAEAAEDQLAVAEVIATVVADTSELEIDAFSQAILADQLQGQSQEEMPRLLGVSLLLIVGILAFQYRSVSDVVLGFLGLIVTIMWMFGLGVLLGPDFLGVVGPFTQISTAVPVLLVGLGIDYAIHLTSRYREEQNHGVEPDRASAVAVRAVGGALVLATITTVVGFLTNVVSPLPPMADFGIFTAVGVVSAFLVMALLIPAARHVLDARPRGQAKVQRRRERVMANEAAGRTAQASGLSAVMGRTAAFAEHIPRITLAVAAVVTVAAGAAATQIETSFSQDDFIPEDSEPGMVLDKVDRLFGGDLTEQTYVIVDGDITDPQALDALEQAEAELADAEYVRSSGGAAEVTSPLSLLRQLADQDPAFAAAAADLGFDPAGGLADGADPDALFELARESAPAFSAQVIGDDSASALLSIATNAGQDDAQAAADAIDSAVAPLRDAGLETVVVSQFLVFDEVLDAMTDSQTQGIAITLVAALALLIAYYWVVARKPLLGAITMVPSVAVVGWILGTMVLLDISFNVLTAMVASIGIGIGVPYGIHVTHRFLEDRRRHDTVDEAVRQTLTHTGGAMAGSAATTAAGFGVLVFASLEPLRQFGLIVALTIVYSLVAAVLIQPACLKLWGEWRTRKGDVGEMPDEKQRHAPTAVGSGVPS
ncbi:efflux RND transporter permease subunit [Actinomarinicola tropica]|uniref:MMPL family transporter n=1 Tax=Actinomarinicola tropica TaxID=2789776 RepID=A0A5Q2RGQ2_9ACTN|nr:MMPL family transporter [Actinomarinicola tropica]QGG94002.1 MMPL family transporter [Actinomarinicola tropica]